MQCATTGPGPPCHCTVYLLRTLYRGALGPPPAINELDPKILDDPGKKSRTKLNKNDEKDRESSVMDQASSFSSIRNSTSSFAPFFILIIDFRCQRQAVLSLYTCNLW